MKMHNAALRRDAAGWAQWLIALFVGLSSLVAHAADVQPYEEYDKRTRGAEQVSALTDGLFGDSVSLYNGQTDFSQVDVSIPGNNALPVQLIRRLSIEAQPFRSLPDNLYGAGDWDVDVPYITGTFDGAYRWNTNNSGQQAPRCSSKFFPGTQRDFRINDIFAGYNVHIPGEGDKSMQAIMDDNAPKPNDGQVHLWTTRDFDAFTCKASMLNGYPGEGFVMTTPAGIRYTFDIGIERSMGTINSAGNSRTRVRIYLLASKIEDRYGNKVEYQYDSLAHPTKILSSDGRAITLAYINGQLTTATANTRQWVYQYTNGALSRIVQPDGQAWTYSRTGSLRLGTQTVDWRMGPTCNSPPDVDAGTYSLTITHPSGARGTFEFEHIRHRRSGVSVRNCVVDVAPTAGNPALYTLTSPNFFDVFSLRRKTIDGPGLATPSIWTYSYGSGPSGLIAGAPGSCTDSRTCALAKTVSVVGPNGIKTQSRFGMRHSFNDGRLLSTRIVDSDGRVLRQETMEYMTDAQMAGQPFPDYYASAWGTDDTGSSYLRPLVRKTIVQDGYIWNGNPDIQPQAPPPAPSRDAPPPPPRPPDPPCDGCDPWIVVGDPGDAGSDVQGQASSPAPPQPPTTFTLRADAFDAWARPIRTTKFSSLGDTRSEAVVYADNMTKWIVGQVKSVTCTAPASCANQVITQTDFDPVTAAPIKTYGFGKLKQTLAYYTSGPDITQLGTLTRVTDAKGSAIAVSSWKRGVPQTVRLPATPDQTSGSGQSAAVDDNGWITSTTDENGFVTKRTYDPMGRLTRLDYPTGDAVAWASTTQSFAPMTAPAYGLPAGSWKQVVSTGNARQVLYLDAMWRPVVKETYDNGNPAATRSVVVIRYDAAGRAIFQSLPVRSLGTYTDTLKGVTTTYDGLDRAVRNQQDSELGTLATSVQYLSGFQRLTTMPNGRTTLERFQAFDVPDTSAPITIDLPEATRTIIVRDVYGKPLDISRGIQAN